MTFQPKTVSEFLPRSVPTATEKEYGEMSITELVAVLRIAYKTEDFDKIEEEFVKREAKLRAEIGPLGEKFELERLKRIEIEERLKIREEQYEKGKRAQNNYEQLLKEVKTGGLVEKHAIEELRKKNVALQREVYELKEFSTKMLDEVKSMDELRDKIRLLKEEKVRDKNVLDVLIMKNIELQEAVKKNLTVIEGLKNENGKLTDEKHELKTLFESLQRRYSKLPVSKVKLEESSMPLMSEDASDYGNTEVEPNLGVSFAVKDEKDVSDNELENDTGEPVPLQSFGDTHYSVDTGTGQSPKKGNKEDAIGALGVKFKLEKDIMDLSDDEDDDDKYTSQGLHGEKAISQIIEESEHPQRVEIIKRKRASDIQASTSTSTSSADLFEKENLPVKRNMTRTRGASSYRGKSSSQGENRRLTASAWRRQEEVDIHEEKHNVIEEQHHVQEWEDENVGEEEVGGFPGGPHDTSLLTHYARHVAHALWQGEDRGEIKLTSHGKKLNRFGACHEAIEEIVLNSGLLPLCGISYNYVDKGLLLAFVERWHSETNTFHLPVGEMSITLDDVSSLLHLSIEGEFCPVKDLEWEEARSALVDLLGVDYERAGTEMIEARGPKVRLSWLRGVYTECCEQQQWDYAARAFLLHLVGCSIFANKSGTLIHVSYLMLFRELDRCGRYAWGVAALAYLYEQLGDASFATTRQMAGYMTLLQSWIYEHFPNMGRRRVLSSYIEDRPRATRWEIGRHGCSLVEARAHLDRLTYDGVIWSPYESHRGNRPLLVIALFSGWIRLGDMVHRHLPERVLRQFEFEQSIPQTPNVVTKVDIETIDGIWVHFKPQVISHVRPTSSPYDCVKGYLQWFRRVSHPYMIPGADLDRMTLAPRLRRHIPDDVSVCRTSPFEFGVLDNLRRIVTILQTMISCCDVTEGTVAYDRTNEALQLAHALVKEQEGNNKGGRHVRSKRSS